MIKKLFFSIILKDTVKELIIVSRLNWKNKVYKCITKDYTLSIKVFTNKLKGKDRYKNEFYFYNLFNHKRIITTPRIVYSKNYLLFSVLITNWVEGQSLKTLINEKGINDNIEHIKETFKDLHKIWNLKINDFNKYSNNNFYNKCNKSIDYVIDKLTKKRKELNNLYNKVYKIYLELNSKCSFNYNNIINTDISVHEFIIGKKKNTWLDFESFSYGDINNDLAGVFYSISNSFIKEIKSIKTIYDIVKKEPSFDKEKFIYYLIERVLLADFLCKKSIPDKEIEFYLEYIIKKYNLKK